MRSKAYRLAGEAHGLQSYDGYPYMCHLQQVVDVLRDFDFGGGFVTPEMYDAAYLHDVLEDTKVGMDELVKEFDLHTAGVVWAVTDSPGATRQERKDLTIPYIRRRGGYEAVIVKLCDRIANVEYSHEHSASKYHMYKDEYSEFRHHLYRAGECEYLWQRLSRAVGPTAPTTAAPSSADKGVV